MPKRLLSPELCIAAVQAPCPSHSPAYPALFYVPESLKNPALCMDAVRKDWRMLAHDPARIMKEGFALAAVLQAPEALKLVPEDARTEAVLAAAAKAEPEECGRA